MKQKLIALLLAAAMMAQSLGVTAFAEGVEDTPADPAAEETMEGDESTPAGGAAVFNFSAAMYVISERGQGAA